MRRSGRCKPCDGAGVVVSRSTCVTCGGRGINITRAEERCSVCAGTGLGPCSRCDGSGRVWKTRVVSLEVPAGVTTGATYRYQSAGHENENGVRADLLVEFTVLARAPRR
jgi:molecular chaperone DnaJ